MSAALIWRIIIAVVFVLFAFAAIPLLISIFGLSVDSAVIALLRLCIAALAVLYILKGETWFSR